MYDNSNKSPPAFVWQLPAPSSWLCVRMEAQWHALETWPLSHTVFFSSRPWRLPSTGCPSSTPSSTPWRSMNPNLLLSMIRITSSRSPPSSTTLTSGKGARRTGTGLLQAAFGVTQAGWLSGDKLTQEKEPWGWLLSTGSNPSSSTYQLCRFEHVSFPFSGHFPHP